MRKKFLIELNALKGLSVLGIVVYHYGAHFQAEPFYSIFRLAYSAGYHLVELLFVISGYLLARSYLHSRRTRFRKNMRRRLFRMYPLHIITLLATACLQYGYWRQTHGKYFIYQYNDASHAILNLLMIQGTGIQKGYSFNGPAWYLSTLFVCSGLFFTILAVAKRKAVTIFAAIALVSAIILLILQGQITGSQNTLLVRALAGFFIGTLTFCLDEALVKKDVNLKGPIYDLIFLGSLLSAILLFSRIAETIQPLAEVLTVFLIFPSMVVTSTKSTYLSNILSCKPLQSLGQVSFSLFLIHFPLQLIGVLGRNTFPKQIHFDSGWFFILYFAAAFLLSCLAYRYIELPRARSLRDVGRNNLQGRKWLPFWLSRKGKML